MSERVRPAAAPHAQGAALGALGIHAIRTLDTPLSVDLATRATLDSATLTHRADQWEAIAQGWQGPIAGDLAGVDLSDLVDWRRVGVVPEGEEPFLVVRIDGRAYGELDRAVGRAEQAMQIEARVLEISPIAREFAAAHGLARSLARIRLANGDGELNHLLRDPEASFLDARVELLIGFRSLSPRAYRPIGPGWIISRIESVDPGSITLELQDASEVWLGEVRPLPTLGTVRPSVIPAVAMGLRRIFETLGVDDPSGTADKVASEEGLLLAEGEGDEPVHVPMGRELVPARRVMWTRRLVRGGSDEGQVARRYSGRFAAYIIGQSRLPNALPTNHDIVGEELRAREQGEFGRLRLLTPGGDQITAWVRSFWPSSRALRDVRPRGVTSQPQVLQTHARLGRASVIGPDGSRWSVWVVVILCLDEYIYGTSRYGWPENWLERDFSGDTLPIYAQWGAEGTAGAHGGWWSGRHDPAAIVAEIATRYLTIGAPGALDVSSLREASDSSPYRELDTTRVAGEIAEGQLGAELLDSIGRTFWIDWWLGADGKIHARPPSITAVDIEQRIPAARRINGRLDIVRDSWEEHIPMGTDRWGLATYHRPVGQKADGNPTDPNRGERSISRIVETDVDLTWWDRTMGAAVAVREGPLARRSERFSHVARFRVGLHALAWELGDYLRITHWAGVAAPEGYRDRLMRIEGITLDWHRRQVEVRALDLGWVEEEDRAWPGILDDERHWERLRRDRPDGATSIVLSEGSVVAQLVGEAWQKAGVKPGDILRFPAADGYGETSRQIVTVAPAAGGLQVTLDEPADVDREVDTMILERSHLDPPTDELWPGRYPVTSRPYIRLADESTGLLPDGSPGYWLQE